MPELAVQATLVEPVDVLGDRDLDVVHGRPGPLVADQLGLEEAVERFGEGVVVAVALGPDRGHGRLVGEAFGVANGTILTGLRGPSDA
nr:hypothetical protein [Streptomyces sp. SM10]